MVEPTSEPMIEPMKEPISEPMSEPISHPLPSARWLRSATALATLVGLPLLGSLLAAVAPGLDAAAWARLAAHPQTAPALWLSLCTGLASFALAAGGAAALLGLCFNTAHWSRLLRPLPAMLALPHAAFAVGFVLLVAPTGWLVRLGVAMLEPMNAHLGLELDAPPSWSTSQDPWGLGLVVVLALKETPFLLWAAAAQLKRPDLARRLSQELRLAQTLGYSKNTAWWRVAWPQVLARMQAPLLAVMVYSLTVVDVALLAGPTTPPTLAVLAWQWLQDADPARRATGAAAAWLLAGVAALVAASALLLLHGGRHWFAARWTRGIARTAPDRHLKTSAPAKKTSETNSSQRSSADTHFAHPDGRPAISKPPLSTGQNAALALLPVAYTAVALALVLGSVIGVWPFPDLWPQAWTWQAWQAVADSAALVSTTLVLGLGSAATALLWTVAWFECAPAHWQRHMQGLLYLPLLLPAVLWALGLHRLVLAWGLDASFGGLWLAHSLCALPYVVLSLQGPYSESTGGFDARLRSVAASLGRSHWAFVSQVKWPLLRGALCASFAVGFAVSVAQYLPTMFVGAGRFATVTTEAVALGSGGARSLQASFAALLWLLPALVFAMGAWLGRPRRFRT